MFSLVATCFVSILDMSTVGAERTNLLNVSSSWVLVKAARTTSVKFLTGHLALLSLIELYAFDVLILVLVAFSSLAKSVL